MKEIYLIKQVHVFDCGTSKISVPFCVDTFDDAVQWCCKNNIVDRDGYKIIYYFEPVTLFISK